MVASGGIVFQVKRIILLRYSRTVLRIEADHQDAHVRARAQNMCDRTVPQRRLYVLC
jgi:hypothetical protein